jgi:hypothetical protein
MNPKFKKGDKALVINDAPGIRKGDDGYVGKVVTIIDSIWHKKQSYWIYYTNFYQYLETDLLPEEIFNSPLFLAIREDNKK